MIMECLAVSAPERYANRDLLSLRGEVEVVEGSNKSVD